MERRNEKGQITKTQLVPVEFYADRRLMAQTDTKKPPGDSITSPAAVTRPRLGRALFRILIRIALIVVLSLLLHGLMSWLMNRVDALGTPGNSAMIGLLTLILIGYAILIAVPFMPGIEVGVALLLLQGAQIAPFVYLATLLGLFLSYEIGSRIPLAWLHSAFRDLHLMKACNLINEIGTAPRATHLDRLGAELPAWLARITVNYRYVTLGLLVNIPGSFAIGGGGGILMLAGVSRLFTTWCILLTLAISVAPIPLVVWLTGTNFLTRVP